MEYRFAHGDFDVRGNEEVPEVRWSQPAIGSRSLTPEEAEGMADYLEDNAGDEHLSFILLGQDPAEVAEHLRDEARRARSRTERFKARVEARREED